MSAVLEMDEWPSSFCTAFTQLKGQEPRGLALGLLLSAERRPRPLAPHNTDDLAASREGVGPVWVNQRSGATEDGERSSTDTVARLLTVTAGLALLAVLFAGCGDGDDSTKVEAGLRDYFASVNPEDTSFPQGAGVVPRVKTNSCKEHPLPPGDVFGVPTKGSRGLQKLRLWSCVVMFGKVAMPAAIDVDKSTGAIVNVMANPPGSQRPPRLAPPRTYTG